MPGYSGYDSMRSNVGLGAHALDLELGDEHRQAARGVDRDADGPLGGEEVEAREVLDVAVVEEHAAGQALVCQVLEQARAPAPRARTWGCR